MEQSHPIYSGEEYKIFLQEFWELERQRLGLTTKTEPIMSIIDKLGTLTQIYLQRLPKILLARCPICGGSVYENIDTFSLNGLGWQSRYFQGVGWFGPLEAFTHEEQQKYKYLGLSQRNRPSFEAECDHIQCLDWCVNLDGQEPSEVHSFFEATEVPHLISRLMDDPGTLAVMHKLPLHRIDKRNARPFNIFFMTYFSEDRGLMNKVINSMNISEPIQDIFVFPPWDYDLQKWVRMGRLYWLDPNDPQGKLITSSLEKFPYGNVIGHKEGITIRNGKVVYPRSIWKMLGDFLS